MSSMEVDGFEVVEMESDDSVSMEKNPGRSYEEFINDPTPVTTYHVNGISYLLKNSVNGDSIRKLVLEHGNCMTCYARTKNLFSICGREGPCFLSNVQSEYDGCERGCIHKIRQEVLNINKKLINPTVVIIDKDTFPDVKDGIDPETNLPFEHFTIKPDKFTSPENSEKFRTIARDIMIYKDRIQKLSERNAVESVKMIYYRLDDLERPNHWKGVFKWVMDNHNRLEHYNNQIKSGNPYLWPKRKENEIKFLMYCMTSGRIDYDGETIVNKDYKQSSNIIDFLSYSTMEESLREMDIRSNPENYMVSQLSRNLKKNAVKSKWGISISWEGKYKDDMDLELYWYHPNSDRMISRIYYGAKVAFTSYNGTEYKTVQDFDANAARAEAEPSENFSCNPYGRYVIRVNNYNRKTHGRDIPFTVIISQEGNDPIIIERTWPPERESGNFMIIGEHTFSEITSPELVMSTKAASRAKAVCSEWDEFIGEPKSIIPTLENLSVPVHTWEKKKSPSNPSINSLTSSFMDMAVSTVEENAGRSKRRKIYLSERDNTPSNITELVTYLSTGEHTLKVDWRSYTPGYVTEIITKTKVTKRPYSLCHYSEKFKVPDRPSSERPLSNARFDPSWFNMNVNSRDVDVEAIIKFGTNWFMVLKGATLPVNNSDYPLGGGFHPGALNPTYHNKHNYQWTFCNTRILPELPSVSGTPIIGSFLVTNEVEVFLDGKKIRIKTN